MGGGVKKTVILISWIFAFFLFVGYSSPQSSNENSIKDLDKQIESLEVIKKQHQKNIEKHLNLAHRWQKNEDLALESRREYALADNQKDKVHILERKLEKLKKEKVLRKD